MQLEQYTLNAIQMKRLLFINMTLFVCVSLFCISIERYLPGRIHLILFKDPVVPRMGIAIVSNSKSIKLRNENETQTCHTMSCCINIKTKKMIGQIIQ